MRATKHSGVDWLGDVPETWGTTPLRTLMKLRTERNTAYQSANYLSLMANIGVIPYAEKGDIGNKAPEDLGKCKIVYEGDFVLNSMNFGIGSFGVSAYNGICSSVYVVMQPRLDKVSPPFLRYIFTMQPFQKHVQSLGNGILEHRAAIGWDELKNIGFPMPPKEEQQAIADFLDRETAKIDKLIAKQEQLITTLGERRKAVIWRGVTQSVCAVKLGVGDRLDWKLIVPNSWRVKPLWMVTGFSTGWTPPSGNDAFYSDEYPWVNISDLGPRELRTTVKGLSSFATNSIRLKKTLRGQLMFSFKLSIGQVSFAGLDCYTNEAIASFHSSEQLRLDYAFYMLPICVPENAGENIYGAKMLNAQRIKTARIILPPLEEQESVASFLNGATTKIDSLIARARKANAFLVERRQSLISAAVTGKIDLSKGV